MADTVFVRIDGEPFQGRAVAYRTALIEASATWGAFRVKVGALAVCRPHYFQFSAEPPLRRMEWIKAENRRADWWMPAKRSPLAEEVARLPALPETSEIFGDAIVDTYHYRAGETSGGGCIGRMFSGPRVGWADDVFVCLIPDPADSVAYIRSVHPDAVFDGGIEHWQLPPGLTRMTDAEAHLFFAQAKVDGERRAKATEHEAPR